MIAPRLRVVMVVPESTGGIGRHVRDITAALVTRGHDVTVVAPQNTLRRFDFSAFGAHVSPASIRLVRTHARAADLVHAHGVRAGAAAALLGGQTPLVVTWHNAPLGGVARRAVHRALERVGARRADVVLGASPDLVVRATASGARRAEPFAVVAPQRPVARATSTPLDLEALAGGVPVVLCVARLHPQKRLDLLVDAVAARGDRRVLVVGDGPLRGALEARAGRRDAPVTFLGAREDVPALLTHADLFVLPSDWEARPLAVQEAMAAGVPVVATDVGGVRDLVGDAAMLVPRGDARALAAAIDRLLGDEQERERYRALGHARAQIWPTLDATVDHLETLYLDLKARSRHAVGRR